MRSPLSYRNALLLWAVAVSSVASWELPAFAQTGKIFWGGFTQASSNPGYIRKANLDGSNPQTLLSGLNGAVLSLDINFISHHIYWVESASGSQKIQRANFNGANVVDIYTGAPESLSINWLNGHIYWIEDLPSSRLGEIRRSNFDGSNMQTLVTGAGYSGIEADPVNGYVYWSNGDNVWRANLDGTSPLQIFSNVNANINSVSADWIPGRVYWTDVVDTLTTGLVQYANPDGSGLQRMSVALQDKPLGIDARFATLASKVWWINKGQGNAGGSVSSSAPSALTIRTSFSAR